MHAAYRVQIRRVKHSFQPGSNTYPHGYGVRLSVNDRKTLTFTVSGHGSSQLNSAATRGMRRTLSSIRVVRRAPIRHDDALEVPLLLHHFPV
jgi:hypothetical protein